MNKTFFSAAALMVSLISNSQASCDPIAANPASSYGDCVKRVAQTFQQRASNISHYSQEKKEAMLEEFKETAKYEKDVCRQTCKDAPQAYSAG